MLDDGVHLPSETKLGRGEGTGTPAGNAGKKGVRLNEIALGVLRDKQAALERLFSRMLMERMACNVSASKLLGK